MRRRSFTLRLEERRNGQVWVHPEDGEAFRVVGPRGDGLRAMGRRVLRGSAAKGELQDLVDLILRDDARAAYVACRGVGGPAICKLDAAPSLQSFPWERLSWPDDLLVVRDAGPARALTPRPEPIRILVVAPEFEGAAEHIQHTVETLQSAAQTQATVETLSGDATWSSLRRRLLKPPDVHILHFVAHGRGGEDPTLQLLADDGDPDRLDAESSKRLIPSTVRLVYLDSCDTALPDTLASTGERMARRAGAAIAQIHGIDALDAVQIAKAFYEALLDGRGGLRNDLVGSLDSARGAMRGPSKWSPVLFLAGESTELFAPPSAAPLFDVPAAPWQVAIVGTAADIRRAEPLIARLERAGYRVASPARPEMSPAAMARALGSAEQTFFVASAATLTRPSPPPDLSRALPAYAARASKAKLLYLDAAPDAPAPWTDPIRSGGGATISTPARMAQVAEGLVGWLAKQLDQERGPEISEPVHQRRRFYQGLGLDRSSQWERLLQWTASRNLARYHTTFLLFGERRQNLELFVERAQHWLTEESLERHTMYCIPVQLNYAIPRTAAEWLLHLAAGLKPDDRSPRRPADAALRDAAASGAVLLTFDRRLDPARFDAKRREALSAFLSDRWPRLLGEARPAHPVRLLVAVDYEDPADRMDRQLAAALRVAPEINDFRFVPLPEVEMADWDHIADYITSQRAPPPTELIDQLRARYDALDPAKVSFQQLAQLLDDNLK